MKNLFYFIATILLLTACVDPVQEQLEIKKKELERLGVEMDNITQKIHDIINQKSDAESFVFRLEAAGALKTSKDYKNAVADVERLASVYDSLNIEADKISIEFERVGSQMDSLLLLK